MKKFLSILLALVMCLGLFVSCNNEEQPSNQENEETVKYYKKMSGIEYIGDDMPTRDNNGATGLPFGSYYKLILTYDDFLESFSDTDKIDANFFDKNFLYVICHYSTGTLRSSDEYEIGYRNFYIDNKTAYLTLDKTFAFGNTSAGGNPIINVQYTYVTIPKEMLSDADVSSVQSYKIIHNKVQYYHSIYFLIELDEGYQNGDAWVLNNEKSYEDFQKNVCFLWSGLNFEENVYIAIYREGSNLSNEIGYFDLTNEGEDVKLTTWRNPDKKIHYRPTGAHIDVIIVPRGRLKFGIDSLKSTENIKIEIKNIEYFD